MSVDNECFAMLNYSHIIRTSWVTTLGNISRILQRRIFPFGNFRIKYRGGAVMDNRLLMTIDMIGRIRNTKLSNRNGLQPLFEAIINSFQAIEDRNVSVAGFVKIILHRHPQMRTDTRDRSREPIVAMEIQDNGIGFNNDNFNSFLTADTTLKESRGGKGVGRFIWLKAFEKVQVDSVFEEDGRLWRRTFDFSRRPGGIGNHEKTEIDRDTKVLTKVILQDFKSQYWEYSPKTASVIARRTIEHCFEYFLFQDVPRVDLVDGDANESYNLNDLFTEEFKPESMPKEFKLNGETFTIHDILITKPQDHNHQVHFCAHHRVVTSESLSNRIPHLDGPLHDTNRNAMAYSVYVSSPFLDRRVESDRTEFRIPRRPVPLAGGEITWQGILDSVVQSSKQFLEPYTASASEKAIERVEKYVETEAPRYRHLLSSRREALNRMLK